MYNKLNKVLTVIIMLLMVGVLSVGCNNNEMNNKETNLKSKKSETTTKDEYSYDNNQYFTDISWLEANLNNNKVIIIDTRQSKEYKKGHIPGAINAEWQKFSNMDIAVGDKGWGTLYDKEKLSEIYSSLGISQDKKVVVYGTKEGWGEDGRLLWMFKETGIDSRMLNGGIDLWKKEGKAISKDSSEPIKSDFKIDNITDDMTITTDKLRKNLDEYKVIDTREKDEYNGATKYGESRGGHIPGAINLTFNKVYNDDGTIKSKSELETIFKDFGLEKNKKIVAYCTGGIRSAHLTLILKSIGYENVKNYDASYQEWAGDKSNEVEK